MCSLTPRGSRHVAGRIKTNLFDSRRRARAAFAIPTLPISHRRAPNLSLSRVEFLTPGCWFSVPAGRLFPTAMLARRASAPGGNGITDCRLSFAAFAASFDAALFGSLITTFRFALLFPPPTPPR